MQSDDFYSFNHYVPRWGFKAFYSYIIKFTSNSPKSCEVVNGEKIISYSIHGPKLAHTLCNLKLFHLMFVKIILATFVSVIPFYDNKLVLWYLHLPSFWLTRLSLSLLQNWVIKESKILNTTNKSDSWGIAVLSWFCLMRARLHDKKRSRTTWKIYITFGHSLMLLWFADVVNVTEKVTVHRPNVSTLLSSAFIRVKALDRSVETLGLWIITSSVTFIKSANQSSIKLCLIVHLVAVWTLIYYI